jgi:hypothetical protein
MTDRLDKAWQNFLDVFYPDGMPDLVKKESRRAFYAGAEALYGGMIANIVTDDVDDKSNIQLALEFVDEMEDFARQVHEGLA